MNVEIVEVVYFITSFLAGRVPRTRIDVLAESLANRLALRVYLAKRDESEPMTVLYINNEEEVDNIITEAAEDACIDAIKLLAMLPVNMALEVAPGFVQVRNSITNKGKIIYSSDMTNGILLDNRRPQFHTEFSVPWGFEADRDVDPLAHFEIAHQDDVLTARELVATRFGSIRPRTYTEHGFEREMREDNFTKPSLDAYTRLITYLNSIATLMSYDEEVTFDLEIPSLSKGFTDTTQSSSDERCEVHHDCYCNEDRLIDVDAI